MWPQLFQLIGWLLSNLELWEEGCEEKMEEVVAVPPGGDLPTDSSDEFDFTI